MNQKMTGEECFSRYALPVARFCGKLDEDEILELKITLSQGNFPSREYLESKFPDAVEKMREYLKLENPGEYWRLENVRAYWLKGHNQIVEDNPFCKVYIAEISEVKNSKNGRLEVKIKLGNIEKDLETNLDLKKGDKVTIHASEIVEKLSPEDIKKYPNPS